MIIWKNKALVLSKTNYSETSLILKVFTDNKGIQKGLVKGGKKLKKSNIYETGNLIAAEWKAKNRRSLGIFNCELLEANSGIFIRRYKKIYIYNINVEFNRILFSRK